MYPKRRYNDNKTPYKHHDKNKKRPDCIVQSGRNYIDNLKLSISQQA
jgi:hypothetical protein